MDDKTLTALRGSIKKWEKIVNGDGIDDGYRNCPLCELFYLVPHRAPCAGCPVRIKTSKLACDDTPYVAWVVHGDIAHEGHFRAVEDCDECRRLALAELEFLKSLLPEE